MYRVLVVDDDKLARKGLISIVPWSQCGMGIVGDVPNGVAALDFIENNQVDLVVVDISMPILSGLDFIKECKKRHSEINYVVLSFYEEFEYVQSALRLGALDYISKSRLDQEDCVEIFTRVRVMLDAEKKVELAADSANNADYLEKLCLDMGWLFWVYNRELTNELAERIALLRLNSNQSYKIFVTALNSAKAALDICLDENEYEYDDCTGQWVQKMRKDIYEIVGGDKLSEKIECLILKAVIFINENIASDQLKSELIADKVNMSRGYFSINFKKFTGFTVNSYIRKERMILAKGIMEREKISVIDLAYRVGYKDEKYFARIFYEQEGVTCSEFRKQMSENSQIS